MATGIDIIATDKVVHQLHRSPVFGAAQFIDVPGVESMNIAATKEELALVRSRLTGAYLFVGGSSNFHHLDAAAVSAASERVGGPLQLVLIDAHMDCMLYSDPPGVIHCGSWVSYTYRTGAVKRVVILGARDTSRLHGFDSAPWESGSAFYAARPTQEQLHGFLDHSLPTYVSVDADVLRSPGDWGRGPWEERELFDDGLWGVLRSCNVVGASIFGVLSDGRGLGDWLHAMVRRSGVLLAAAGDDHVFRRYLEGAQEFILPKFRASLALGRPTPAEQVRLTGELAQRLLSLRKVHC